MNKSYDDLDLLESTPNKGKAKNTINISFYPEKNFKNYFGNPSIARQRRTALNANNQYFSMKNSNLELKKLNKEKSELMQMVKELNVCIYYIL